MKLKGFNYLVRNEIGTVEVFVNKPQRKSSSGAGYSTWCERDYPMTREELNRRKKIELGEYKFVTWASEPILVSGLIEEKE